MSGSTASLVSTALLALLGWRELGDAAAPTNATSHWIWGDEAYDAHGPSWRHTALGYVTHHASAVFWGMMFEGLLGRTRAPSASTVVSAAAATTATAAFIDYIVTPPRLRPGFEEHLSTGELIAVFAAIGTGLAIGGMIGRARSR